MTYTDFNNVQSLVLSFEGEGQIANIVTEDDKIMYLLWTKPYHYIQKQ